MKRRDLIKGLTLLPVGGVLAGSFEPVLAAPAETNALPAPIVDLSKINPGSYDGTWWNRTPIRLVQTNLPEVEGSMDRDAYVQSMVDASANAVLFNTGGIVCNYQTKLPYHWKNPHMGSTDLVKDLIGKFHQKGIKYIGRFDFSKLDESIAKQKPEWLFVGTKGDYQIYNGLYSACINGGYYQQYAFDILKEAIAENDMDGIFFNMMGYTGSDYSGRNYGICQCQNCKDRFLKDTGMTLPVTLGQDAVSAAYNAFRTRTSNELYTRVTDFIKQQNPKLIIYNYNAVGTHWMASESGASMNTGVDNIYEATNNFKRVIGSYRDRTPVALTMVFQAIGYRNIGTSSNILRNWWLQNMLHGVPTAMVVVGTLVHYEDRVFITIANELFGFHKTHEKLFTNVQAVNKVALINGTAGMLKLLSEEHIMYDVVLLDMLGSPRMPKKLTDYDVLILDDIPNLNDDAVALLDNYVQNGGKILATGATGTMPGNKIRLKSLGVEADYERYAQAQSTFLKVSDADKKALAEKEFNDFTLMMMYSNFLKTKPKSGAQSYLRLLPATRFGPAEKTYYADSDITNFPGAVAYTYGQGKTVFIPWQIGSEYNIKGNYAQRALFNASLNSLLKVPKSLETNASPLVEMTHLANLNGQFEWVGMINHSGWMGTSVREYVNIHDTTVRIKPQKPVKEVKLLRSGLDVKFKKDGDWIEVLVPKIADFEMMLCLYS